MKSRIEKIVFETIINFNKTNHDGFEIKPEKKAHLTGAKSNLDSVALIGLLLEIEKNINKNFKKKILIADEKVFKDVRILKNIDSLINHISSKINGK